MQNRLPSFVAALLLLAPPIAAAQTLPDPRSADLAPDERVEALVQRVKAEQQKVTSLQARFVQRQESEFLIEPEVSRGTFFYAAPDKVRWEYEEPNPITLLIAGDTMLTWYHDLERAEEVKVGRYSERVLKYLGAGGSLEELVEYFETRTAFPDDPSEPYRMELTPRYERISKRLESLTLWIDPQRYLLERLRFVGAEGDVTDLSFEEIEVNPELAPTRFEVDLPEGVEVTKIDLEQAAP